MEIGLDMGPPDILVLRFQPLLPSTPLHPRVHPDRSLVPMGCEALGPEERRLLAGGPHTVAAPRAQRRGARGHWVPSIGVLFN